MGSYGCGSNPFIAPSSPPFTAIAVQGRCRDDDGACGAGRLGHPIGRSHPHVRCLEVTQAPPRRRPRVPRHPKTAPASYLRTPVTGH